MKSLWNDIEAKKYQTDLQLRVYTSRLLGRNSSLVLHGGGNTSVKIKEKNLFNEEEEIIYIKGSGWDLATIEEAGFSPVRIAPLLKLAKLKSLSDSQMVNELKSNTIRANAPSPSVETILHAILPYKYVDHTHADSIVTITNNQNGLARIQEIYGDEVVIIPYVMPGFDLAKTCAEKFSAEVTEKTKGMVLMNHGLFTFGETAPESYEMTIELVSRAEEYLEKHNAFSIKIEKQEITNKELRYDLAKLRWEISKAAGFPVILKRYGDERSLAFTRRKDVNTLSQQGPATPDHIIRTKRVPLIGRDINSYVAQYKEYFAANAPQNSEKITMLDPAPRVILDPELGMCTVGKTVKNAKIVSDIYQHTMDIIERSTALGGYMALPTKDLFAVEYWELEQAKLKKSSNAPIFTGEIVLITGVASGIGKACVDSFLQRGAAVIGLDLDSAVEELNKKPDFLGITCDVTDEKAITNALEKAIQTFGGLDMLVLNAGIFPQGCDINQLVTEHWRKVMSVNLDANLILMRECHPFLKLAPKGGRVAVIGSKNVPAPGSSVAAYSTSKAALNQLARVAALEWGKDGIRINTLHPNAVFDTKIWTEDVLQARAEAYQLTVEEYKTKNLLKVEITSHKVAELAAEICSPVFACTTGAQIPIDGGNERVI